MSAHATARWEDHPCENPIEHRPHPLRTVSHHVQPEAAGGANGPRVWLCDNCHYNTHRVLYALRLDYEGKSVPRVSTSYFLVRLASDGFALCVAAGTVHLIPNEG